ncbi:MAG TPA: N-acetyltransferase, partial [Anaerolineae bacterium]|nr:N-acetyltransferase [Anaerolineae bacterium]
MEIIQLDTGDRRQVRQFLDLPFVLYRSTPQWVPPLAPEARHVLDRRHPFYRHSDAAFFLAVADGRVAGRIAVLDNHNYNEFNKERTAFFCLFECAENAGAAQGLFDAAFAWARGRGLERLVGPKGFTALDGLGLLVRGFEHRPAFGIPYNLPYYGALVEAAGFTGSGDIVSGYLHRSAPFPERIHRAAELIMKHRGLSIARFTSRRDLRALVPKLGRLYNEALAGTTGNVPLTDDELRVMAEQ